MLIIELGVGRVLRGNGRRKLHSLTGYSSSPNHTPKSDNDSGVTQNLRAGIFLSDDDDNDGDDLER